jgi:hypothetical protein
MNLATIEIPKETWQTYFNDLGRIYRGWGATIEVLAGELGEQPVAKEMPLQGMSYEYKGGSMACDVLVEVGDAGAPFTTHRIARPRAVRAALTRPGEETDVEIEGEDGTTTIVRIRRRPELPPPRRS